MAAPVVVNFVVGGVKDVLQSFRTVARAQQDMERQIARSAATEVRARQKGAASVEAIREREFRQLVRKLAAEDKAEERAAAKKQRIVEAQERNNTRIRLNSFREAQRQRDRDLAAFERVEQRKLQIQLRSAALASKELDKQARLEAKAAEKALAARQRVTSGIAGTITSSIGGTLRTIAGVAGGLTALGGGFSVADSVSTEAANRGRAADLANQSGGKVSAKALLEKSSVTATQFGTSTEKVIGGLDEFVAKSGDVDAGMKMIGKLVELANATGADLGELSRTAGIVHMGTGDAAKTMEQMRQLAGAGREGSVDMRELSQYAGRVSAGASQFADKGKAFSELSAIVQQAAATGGATAAPEATEAVTRLSSDILEKEDVFKEKGIKTRDPSGKYLRGARDIIKDSIIATGGDSKQLLNMYGKMSYRAVAGFQDIYNRAGGGKKGEQAMDAAFDRFQKAALTEAQVRADNARRMEEADKQFEAALNDLRDAVGKELLPELTKLMPKIRELIPAFVSLLQSAVAFADWMAANPIAGLGALVLTAVAKDLAEAKIGAVVSSAIASLMNSAGAVSAGTSAGGAVANAVGGTAIGARIASGIGAAGTAIGSGVTALGAGTLAAGAAVGGAVGTALGFAGVGVEERLHKGKQTEAVMGSVGNQASISDLLRAPDSDERTRKLLTLQTAIRGQIADTEKKRANAGPSLLTGKLANLVGKSADVDEARKTEQAAYTAVLKSLTADMERLSKAIADTTGTLGGKPTGAPGPGAPAQNTSMANPLRGGSQ